jgi:hypothetical protein
VTLATVFSVVITVQKRTRVTASTILHRWNFNGQCELMAALFTMNRSALRAFPHREIFFPEHCRHIASSTANGKLTRRTRDPLGVPGLDKRIDVENEIF